MKVNAADLIDVDMPSERSKAIWEQSVPLSAFVVGDVGKRLANSPLISIGIGWRLLEMIAKTSEALVMPGNTMEQTRKAIRRGALVATAYRCSPSRSASPVIIGPAIFANARIALLQNAIVGTGFRYADVRVIAKTAIPKKLRPTRPHQSLRLSEMHRIISALHELGRLNGLRKQQVQIVRNALLSAGIKNVGQDKTIERLIRISIGSAKSK